MVVAIIRNTHYIRTNFTEKIMAFSRIIIWLLVIGPYTKSISSNAVQDCGNEDKLIFSQVVSRSCSILFSLLVDKQSEYSDVNEISNRSIVMAIEQS